MDYHSLVTKCLLASLFGITCSCSGRDAASLAASKTIKISASMFAEDISSTIYDLQDCIVVRTALSPAAAAVPDELAQILLSEKPTVAVTESGIHVIIFYKKQGVFIVCTDYGNALQVIRQLRIHFNGRLPEAVSEVKQIIAERKGTAK